MRRIKWLWWKFWAWLTTPWRPEDVTNPRSKKKRGDPTWVLFLTRMMYAINCMMGAVIVVALLMLLALNLGPQ